MIGIDVPIGMPVARGRLADDEARCFVQVRRSSVFPTPPRAALEAQSHAEAIARCRELGLPGVSAQAYALRGKILEVDERVTATDHIYEVHPEVSFRELAGAPLRASKSSWSGLLLRRRLLAEGGIALPDELPQVDAADADDVLDATVAAWSANRIARGEAESLPNPPERDHRGRPVAIWY